MKAPKRRIVYLLGAGATQAEVMWADPSIQLLMSEVRDGIIFRIQRRRDRDTKRLRGQLATPGMDVEHLITLYEAGGIPKYQNIAKELKRLFRIEIQSRLRRLPKKFQPTLLPALLDMHSVEGLQEQLVGIITLNYEDLLERSSELILGGVNYEIEVGGNLGSLNINRTCVPILKLHGSFNWCNEQPVSILPDKGRCREDQILWIPPGVEKKREKYPFSLLWGRAREILDCDIVRVVGCSLSRNDWELVSLLYTMQTFCTTGRSHTIQFIDYPSACEDVIARYPYLKIVKFLDIEEVRRYYISHNLPGAKFDSTSWENLGTTLAQSVNSTKTNVFEVWLRSMGEEMIRRNIKLDTPKLAFREFIEAGLP